MVPCKAYPFLQVEHIELLVQAEQVFGHVVQVWPFNQVPAGQVAHWPVCKPYPGLQVPQFELLVQLEQVPGQDWQF